MSRHRKKPTEQGALTNWKWEKKELVRTWKETGWARSAHTLETAEGGTCQDMDGK